MDTATFFSKILPSGGIKVLAELVPYTDKKTGKTLDGWRYKTFESFEAMAEAAAQFDSAGRNVYHACHGYNDWYMDEARNKKRIRTAVNVTTCRSLFDDIDVAKPDKDTYATTKEAMTAVRAMVKAVGLPAPLVVYSGGGVHLYWPLTTDIDPGAWLELSALKRRITAHFGLKVDRAVDMDLARVLRPIGATNRKYEHKPTVEAKNDPPATDPVVLHDIMAKYITANNVPHVKVSTPTSGTKNAFAAAGEGLYEPSYADNVAKNCAQIRWFKETGAPDEPVWHKCLGVVKLCEDGEAIVHDWSSQYEKYDAAETQMKLDAWQHGPTRCDVFKQVAAERCQGCAHKVSSPILLGRTETTRPPESFEETREPEAAVEAPMTRQELLRKCWPTRFFERDGSLMFSQEVAEGTFQDKLLSKTVFWPTDWVRASDGTWDIAMEHRTRNSRVRQFVIPAASLSSADKMSAALASHGVFLAGLKHGGVAVDYTREFLHNLQFMGAEIEIVKAFGWSEDQTSFILGNQRISEDKTDQVRVSDEIISSGMGRDFGVKGQKKKWVELVDRIYNRPGAELYQFLFLVAASAPLVKIANLPNFHGIPTALTGESGLGKTTTCQVAMSMWGDPALFTHIASQAGSTSQALLKRIAILRHLPRIFDEMTGQKLEILRDLFFALSNGQGKDRLTSSGGFATGSEEWDTPSFITGNLDITGMLSNLDSQQRDAAMVRVFEIKLPDDYNEKLWPNELAEVKRLIAEELPATYGHIGRDLIKFYIQKRDKLREHILTMRSKFGVDDKDQQRERFYIDNLVLAMVAGHVMKKLGFINFDLAAIKATVMNTIKSLRAARKATSYTEEEHVGQFLSWLYGRVLITKHIGSARSGDSLEMPIETPRNEAPQARMAVADKRFIVSAKALNDYCKEAGGVSSATVRDWMDKHGYILHVKGREKSGSWTFRIGQGTHVTTGHARCYELDYSKVFDHRREDSGNQNVVSLVKTAHGAVANSVAGKSETGATGT